MPLGLLGKKVGMTHVYDESGSVIPVTVIQAGPCVVLQVKTSATDGYDALQLGFGDQKPHRVTKPFEKHCAKADTLPKRFVREIKLDGPGEYELGQQLRVDIFNEVKTVSVTGTSKGKGFAGVMKRHGFKGFPSTHGQMGNRIPGSIGTSATPSRVLKGTRMGGHMGACRVTTRNLKVVSVDEENNLLVVKGAIPGCRSGYLIIQTTS